MSKKRRQNRNGFTLLEVMVALSILAGVMVTVFGLHGRTLFLVDRARSEITAPLLARGIMAKQMRELPEPAALSGTFSAFPDMEWKSSVVPVSGLVAEEEKERIYRIRVEILKNGVAVWDLTAACGVPDETESSR